MVLSALAHRTDHDGRALCYLSHILISLHQLFNPRRQRMGLGAAHVDVEGCSVAAAVQYSCTAARGVNKLATDKQRQQQVGRC